ncbi:MAG: transporter [Dehalococcoidia bacterium]|nr:transporter [Dehalococcoidia bacterium]
MWHAPAFGTLAAEYPENRATALSFHRMGGSIGDTIAPTAIGILLGGGSFWFLEFSGFTYREVALFLAFPAVVGAALVAYGYRNLYSQGSGAGSFKAYIESALPLLSNPTVVSMVSLSSLWAFAFGGLNIFLVLYMREDLGFSEAKAGLYFSLLSLMGIVSGPTLAYLSDKWGRRPVIVLGMAAVSLLILSLIPFGRDSYLLLIILALGVFLYTTNTIMMAAAIDATGSGTEGTGIALMFTGPAIVGAVAPIVAGFIRENYTIQGLFLTQGMMVGVVAIAALFVPIKKANQQPP